ncbi:MAG: ISKra4 family transposase, partial [Prevotellaceae bacterium]|nr:ISKra4 family transposase [Prevotellaceae bacterium]
SKSVSSKYSRNSAGDVQRDLEENHSRYISGTYIQKISQAVGDLAVNREQWTYHPPVEKDDVSTVGISLDGTCMLLREESWRQAMVGSISFYDRDGERLNSIYVAQAPEYGKKSFYALLRKEIEQVRKEYEDKIFIGVADGAADNWTFLQPFVNEQILDFFHASEYLTKVSKAAHKNSTVAHRWLEKARHKLKHETNGAKEILEEMRQLLKKKITQEKKGEISKAITYFTNHIHQMNYAEYLSKNMPIGSGVIEAACKVIIKQRMCKSGMKWSDSGAKTVLLLRCFNETDGKWTQFWNKVMRYGSNIK